MFCVCLFFFWLELILVDLLKVFMCETRTEWIQLIHSPGSDGFKAVWEYPAASISLWKVHRNGCMLRLYNPWLVVAVGHSASRTDECQHVLLHIRIHHMDHLITRVIGGLSHCGADVCPWLCKHIGWYDHPISKSWPGRTVTVRIIYTCLVLIVTS